MITSTAPTMNRAAPAQSTGSTVTMAGYFVKECFESLSPFYLTDIQKQEGAGVVELPSFGLNTPLLAERLIACVNPSYRLLTTLFPKAGPTRSDDWLPQSVIRAIAVASEVIHSSATRLNPVKLAARLVNVVSSDGHWLKGGCFSLLAGLLPQASARTIEVDSADTLRRIGQDLPLDGIYQQTADIQAEDVASIGTYGKPFTGIYDGDGHTIEGLQNCLFGALSQAGEVREVVFKNATITNVRKFDSAAVIVCDMYESSSLTNNEVAHSVVSDQSKFGSAGLAFGFCHNHWETNKITNFTARHTTVSASGNLADAGNVGGVAENVIVDGTRLECSNVFVKHSDSHAGAVVGAVYIRGEILDTIASDCTIQGNNQKHGSIEIGMNAGRYTDHEISGTVACNVVFNDRLINDPYHCPENNSTNNSCPAVEKPFFPEDAFTTSTRVTEVVPDSTMPSTFKAPTQTGEAIHDSSPATPPFVGFITVASAVVALGVAYVAGNCIYSCFKRLGVREICLSPFTNGGKILGWCRRKFRCRHPGRPRSDQNTVPEVFYRPGATESEAIVYRSIDGAPQVTARETINLSLDGAPIAIYCRVINDASEPEFSASLEGSIRGNQNSPTTVRYTSCDGAPEFTSTLPDYCGP